MRVMGHSYCIQILVRDLIGLDCDFRRLGPFSPERWPVLFGSLLDGWSIQRNLDAGLA